RHFAAPSGLPLFTPGHARLADSSRGGGGACRVPTVVRRTAVMIAWASFSSRNVQRSMSLQPGQIIEGKYRIIRLLGEGGMGAVYEGENLRIHRRVAIKVLHPGTAENVDAVQRFEREAQAAGRIGSDHIVEVIDLGNLPAGDRFMVMEYLDGESLSQRIQGRGHLTPHEASTVMVQLLEGLGAAHGAGIIHRDLKPDNV